MQYKQKERHEVKKCIHYGKPTYPEANLARPFIGQLSKDDDEYSAQLRKIQYRVN